MTVYHIFFSSVNPPKHTQYLHYRIFNLEGGKSSIKVLPRDSPECASLELNSKFGSRDRFKFVINMAYRLHYSLHVNIAG